MAIAAAREGTDVLLIELEGRSNLGPIFGFDRLSYDEVEFTAGSLGLSARTTRWPTIWTVPVSGCSPTV